MLAIRHLSPMIPSSNVRETAAFLIAALEFKLGADYGNYAIIYRDHWMIHVKQFPGEIEPSEFYLEVDDVNQFWESVKDGISGLRTRAPFDRDYGMREAHIELPHTKTVIYVGQPIQP